MGTKPDYSHGEPPPVKNDGASMHDLVLEDISVVKNWTMDPLRRVMAERKQFGLDKYQTILQAHNGRNPYQDVVDELGDALVYMRQAITEHEALGNTSPSSVKFGEHLKILYWDLIGTASMMARINEYGKEKERVEVPSTPQ